MSHTHHLVISWTTTRKHLLLRIYTCMHMCKYVCKYICKSEGWKLVSLISVELIKPEPHGLPYGWNRFLDNVFVEGNVLPGVKLSQTFQKEKKKKSSTNLLSTLEEVIFPLYHQHFSSESGLFSVPRSSDEQTSSSSGLLAGTWRAAVSVLLQP